MHITPLRSYRATLAPPGIAPEDLETKADQGALPTLRLKATNCGRAGLAAHYVSGLPVLRVERVEEVAA